MTTSPVLVWHGKDHDRRREPVQAAAPCVTHLPHIPLSLCSPILMAKRNLKSALKAHEAKKGQASRQRRAEEAAKQKWAAIVRKANGSSAAARKRIKSQQHTSIAEMSADDATTDAPAKAEFEPDNDSKDGARSKNPMLGTNAFDRSDTILLVGEGNFSFARALLQPPHSHPPQLLLATAYDTEQQCYEKYPDAPDNVAAIRAIAGRSEVVSFGIDAGSLASSKAIRMSFGKGSGCWSKIVFNFPHVGAGHKDETRNVLANQLLLLRFFVSAAPLLTRGELPRAIAKSTRHCRSSHDEDNASEDDLEYASDEYQRSEIDLRDMDVKSTDIENAGNEEEPAPRHRARYVDHRSSTVKKFQPPARAGSLLVTLRNVKPYTLWDLPTLAKRPDTVLATIAQRAPALPRGQKIPSPAEMSRAAELSSSTSHEGKSKQIYYVWRSFVFFPSDWPGYAHRRTVGWRQGLSTDNNEDLLRDVGPKGDTSRDERGECRTFELGLQA